MTKTKYGVIRKTKAGVIKGYVNMSTDYFCFNEVDVFCNYFDLGFNVVDNYYKLVGGDIIHYIYRYKTEDGEQIEESYEEIDHPTMVMVTELKLE